MPVFATTVREITAPAVVTTFNDTTLVLVGDAGGLIYSFLPYDSVPDLANDGRAQLFKLRASPLAGAVLAVIPDTERNIIHAIHAGGEFISASWDASGQLAGVTFDFAEEFVGACRYSDGLALIFEGEDYSALYLTRDIPLSWPGDSLVVDTVIDSTGFRYHPPVATDFDRDGRDEIVMLSKNSGRILVYSCSQAGLIPYEPLYDLYTNDTAAASPTVGDISGNGYPELIVPGTNRLYGFDRNGFSATDFPITVDYGRPGQFVITQPIISDFTGDNLPDIAVSTFDSLVRDKSIDAFYIYYPDPENYPDSFIIVDTVINYSYYNYYSTVHIVSPGISRIAGFPVSAGAFGIRQPGDTVIGAGSALHLRDGSNGLLVTTGADGWLTAWECEWSDNAAIWPMAARTVDGSAYLPLEALGEEIYLSEFLPESRFYNYPNPATGSETRIRFYVNQPAAVTITIIDALGDEIWEEQQEISDGNSDNEIQWNLSGVASGVYHCRIEAVSLSGSESKVAFKTIAVVK
jgi:YD repeat-containing protein